MHFPNKNFATYINRVEFTKIWRVLRQCRENKQGAVKHKISLDRVQINQNLAHSEQWRGKIAMEKAGGCAGLVRGHRTYVRRRLPRVSPPLPTEISGPSASKTSKTGRWQPRHGPRTRAPFRNHARASHLLQKRMQQKLSKGSARRACQSPLTAPHHPVSSAASIAAWKSSIVCEEIQK